MKARIIDSHAHLHDEKFKDDLEEVLKRAKENGVSHFVSVGCDIDTTQKAMKVSEEIDNVYFSAGFHPHEAKFLSDEAYLMLKKLAQHKKCVAVGECGLDYYYNHSNKDEQKKALIAQIKLAHELGLPLIIHLRDAFLDCIDIFDKHLAAAQKVVIHCFSGSLSEALAFSSRGFYISISGIITFKKPGDLLEVVKQVPIEQLMIETDCPYLAPHPFRGKRNEPSFIVHTLEIIAKEKNMDPNILADKLFQNTKKFFSLP